MNTSTAISILATILCCMVTLTQSKPMMDDSLFILEETYPQCFGEQGTKDCQCICQAAFTKCLAKKAKGTKEFIPNALFCVRNQMVCNQPNVCKPVELLKLKRWAQNVSKSLI